MESFIFLCIVRKEIYSELSFIAIVEECKFIKSYGNLNQGGNGGHRFYLFI